MGRILVMVKRFATDPEIRFGYLKKLGIYNLLPDKAFLKYNYKLLMGRSLNLNNPQTYNEKLQWLKLYDRKPEYTTMVDKVAVKKYVADRIGQDHIIPTLGTWEKFEDIDFETLPDRFVLKCTHDSGGVVICPEKSSLDIDKAKQKIQSSLASNYYLRSREWPYKNVPPRIMAEEYIADSNGELIDYKLQCFGGKVDHIFLCVGRQSERGVRYFYFDRDWNYLPYCEYDDVAEYDFSAMKPKNLDKMIEIAETLAADMIQLRVDMYVIDDQILFGELTFYSQSGCDTTITEEADRILGKKLRLPIDDR